ncbi:MAG: TIGR02186 family protein [Pseudomonadota bacterium]
MLRWLALLACLAAPAKAEEVIAGLSQNRISITTNFDGSEILIFGAVKRQAAIPQDEGELGIIIAVEGPSAPVTVRRKDRRFGIWVNVEAADIASAPSFYAISSTATLRDVLLDTEDLRHRISVRRAIRAVGIASTVQSPNDFTNALIRIRESEGLFQTNEGTVNLVEDTLFDTRIRLPANLTEGDYTTRFFLTRDGAVIDQFETVIFVQKVGLERFLYALAHERPLVYGLLSLAIAILAGWGASAIFRYIRS